MINGKNYPWERMEMYLNGKLITDITDINYTDGKETEGIYAGGPNPTAVGRGNYSASGDITIGRHTYDTLRNAAIDAGYSMYDYKPFVIIVSYGTDAISDDSDFINKEASALHTDTLINSMFNKRTFGIKQNDKTNSVKLELFIEKIV